MLELFEKTHVVLEVQLKILHVIAKLGVTLDAAAERESGVLVRVVPDVSKQSRMNHAAAHHFNPASAFAIAAAGASARDTRNVDFRTRFGERKETRTQPRLSGFTK